MPLEPGPLFRDRESTSRLSTLSSRLSFSLALCPCPVTCACLTGKATAGCQYCRLPDRGVLFPEAACLCCCAAAVPEHHGARLVAAAHHRGDADAVLGAGRVLHRRALRPAPPHAHPRSAGLTYSRAAAGHRVALSQRWLSFVAQLCPRPCDWDVPPRCLLLACRGKFEYISNPCQLRETLALRRVAEMQSQWCNDCSCSRWY